MDTQKSLSPLQFKSLSDIRAYKDTLHGEIKKDEEQIGLLWNDLFHTSESKENPSPTQRFTNMFNIGAGIFDGIILGWKLYRKFKGGAAFFGKNRFRRR